MGASQVAGERAEDLVAVLATFERSEAPDGMIKLRCKLPPDEIVPLTRALMRVEAELLVEDAATLDGPP